MGEKVTEACAAAAPVHPGHSGSLGTFAAKIIPCPDDCSVLPGESVSCTLEGIRDLNFSEMAPVAPWSILRFKNKTKFAV